MLERRRGNSWTWGFSSGLHAAQMMQLRAFVLTQKGCTVHQQEKKKPPNRYVTGSPRTAVRVVDESPGVPGAERMAKSGGK